VFQNDVHDGDRHRSDGDTVNRLPVYQNVNVDRLRFRGLELTAGARALDSSISPRTSRAFNRRTSRIRTARRRHVFAEVRVRRRVAAGREPLFARVCVAHNGEQKDVIAGFEPRRCVLPAFTVHDLARRRRCSRTDAVARRSCFGVNNLTNALYAEFAMRRSSDPSHDGA
jgi:hypothetical protein